MVGGDHRAVRILDADIAFGRERVRAAIVDHPVGEKRVVAVVELDVALGGDLGVLVVVDHLVGLQQHRLGGIMTKTPLKLYLMMLERTQIKYLPLGRKLLHRSLQITPGSLILSLMLIHRKT